MNVAHQNFTNTKDTGYFRDIRERTASFGGIFNSHLHLDRSETYHATVELLANRQVRDGSSLSLAGKHALIPMIHDSPLYDPANLKSRVSGILRSMISVGTTRADTVVDTTTDRVGTSAFDTLYELKKELANEIDFRIGSYSPLGFRDDEPDRWELVKSTAEKADFIGLLPERDDQAVYPEHIGYRECCRRAIKLALELGKPIHVHVDQANHAHENGSETVVEVMRELEPDGPKSDEPVVWLIHVIAPSNYDEARFQKLASDLSEVNVGVITCPSAAISMRQYQSLASPTGNSIARVLDFLAAGVHVRIGSDNICDITSPMGTTDLIDEVFVLSNALRYYDIDILSKLAAGLRLDQNEIGRIRAHIDEDRETADGVVRTIGEG